jgi:hypothetical protein
MRHLLLLATFATTPVLAQGHASHEMSHGTTHMRATPAWPEAPGDQLRADSIVAIARVATGKYRDVHAAEADGYRAFAADVPGQRVIHYTRLTSAVKARFTFDAAAPSSLLYRRGTTGEMRLVGVMYTAPADATEAEMNQRVPLSIARWHLHTNICLPPSGTGRDSLATVGARFGFRGTLASRPDCEAAGGRFRESMFGWMVHVNLFEPGPHGPWEEADGGMRHH